MLLPCPFALTGSAPSKSLLDAAVAGELVDVTKRGALVDAMIDSDLGKARRASCWQVVPAPMA